MKICDLHTHSCFSDGTASPTEIVRLAEAAGLSAVALTDHNTSKGLKAFMQAGESSDVITVPGCEFTTGYGEKDTELHIVGLFLGEEAWPEIDDFVELMHVAKKNSNRKLIANLKAAGYEITYGEVEAITQADEFNRAHVARILCKKGYVKSVKEAFDTVLKEGCGYYVPPKRINALTTVRFIKAYGGVAILAHPFLNMSYEELLGFLPEAKKAGLDAIETHYSTFDAEQTKKAKELADKFELLESGGSDYHGEAKPDISLATGRGTLCVPFEFYEKLKEESGK